MIQGKWPSLCALVFSSGKWGQTLPPGSKHRASAPCTEQAPRRRESLSAQGPQALEFPFILPQCLDPELPGARAVQLHKAAGWHRTLQSVEMVWDHLCQGKYLVSFFLARRKVSHQAPWRVVGRRRLPSHWSGPLSVTHVEYVPTAVATSTRGTRVQHHSGFPSVCPLLEPVMQP